MTAQQPEYGIALKKCSFKEIDLRCPFCGVINHFEDDEILKLCVNLNCDEMIFRPAPDDVNRLYEQLKIECFHQASWDKIEKCFAELRSSQHQEQVNHDI